ncbi:97c0c9a9-1f08-4e7b-a9af-d5f7ffaed4e2 [Sclerotinia trifoliorum]|uniref:97c0c9a9-1f08-4e7b-a9af-d5f7ffaed4e2 n=1 Tax=Sclerotinia trifoliorum TaxID=28548 RepID=A0A8H2ZKD0_9HELO|nr:97c0c9a9-1f08-4e7b-a9af-d5f7ffaed4e2 [Sclerotinia trifoliorum]
MANKGPAAYNEVIPPDFFARDENTLQDRSLLLENFLWQQSKSFFRNAREISWKCSFLAACLRRLRDPITSAVENDPLNVTSYRWLMAVQMINTIFDGLWLAWGPKAALIYEALAAKSYSLSLIVGLGQGVRSKIIQRVINALKESVPDLPLEVHVFHPAACVNSALNIEYVINQYCKLPQTTKRKLQEDMCHSESRKLIPQGQFPTALAESYNIVIAFASVGPIPSHLAS